MQTPRVGAIALTLILAACASSDNSDITAEQQATTAAPATTEPATTTTVAEEPATTTTATTTTTEAPEPVVPVQLVSHLFGGMSLEYPSDHRVTAIPRADAIWFFPPGSASPLSDRFGVPISVGRLSQTANGQPITSIDEMIEAIEASDGATVTPGSESVDVLGRETRQFFVTGLRDFPLFSTLPLGGERDQYSWWSPSGSTELHAVELDDSLIVLSASGAGEDALAQNVGTLMSIVASMILTTPDGEIGPLRQAPEAVPVSFGDEVELTFAERKDNGVSVFNEPIFPTPASRQQFLRMGFHMEMTLPEDVYIPVHRSRLLVVIDEWSLGPDDMDFRGLLSLEALVPTGVGATPIGDPIPIDDLNGLLESPPSNLQFDDIDTDAVVGGLPAVTFSAEIVDPVGCGPAESPCTWTLMGAADESVTVHPRQKTLFWVVPDVPDGPLLFTATAPDTVHADAWLARAQAMIDSLVIDLDH